MPGGQSEHHRGDRLVDLVDNDHPALGREALRGVVRRVHPIGLEGGLPPAGAGELGTGSGTDAMLAWSTT